MDAFDAEADEVLELDEPVDECELVSDAADCVIELVATALSASRTGGKYE